MDEITYAPLEINFHGHRASKVIFNGHELPAIKGIEIFTDKDRILCVKAEMYGFRFASLVELLSKMEKQDELPPS
jgi:hypothetical protein